MPLGRLTRMVGLHVAVLSPVISLAVTTGTRWPKLAVGLAVYVAVPTFLIGPAA
jgi:hypothetical protein